VPGQRQIHGLQKDPARRYQSAGEMRNDIQRALAGAPVAAPKRKAWPWVTLAVVIVVLAVAALSIKFLTGSNSAVGVPSVTGMSLVEAENAITGAGLRAGQVSYTPSASVAKNDVISTNPPHGTQVSKGSAVNLLVSKELVPATGHPRGRHSQSASPAPATRPPAPSPTPPSPSPSPTCVVNILGYCV
jgi:hypothetical protein